MRTYLRSTHHLVARSLFGWVIALLAASAANLHVQTPPVWPLQARCPAPPATVVGASLLDETGQLAGTARAEDVMAWKRTLYAPRPPAARAAWLHLWLGEVELGQNHAPDQALWHFRSAERLCSLADRAKSPQDTKSAGRARTKEQGGGGLAHKVDRCRGLAAYDTAVALYCAGAYSESAAAFHRLLVARPAARGFERRRAALWYRHAGACAGYHAERAAQGIPEPERLDPLCGAAGLAVCLRGLDMPYRQPRVVAACQPTGEGNSLRDLVDACPKLGIAGHTVTADDAGLKALPKPLVAYVEHDHFIAVVGANATGVTYVCSDCGRWPGGPVSLTWRQWRALEPGVYLAVAKAGSATDRALARLPAAPGAAAGITRSEEPRPLQVASASLSHLHLWGAEQSATLSALLREWVGPETPAG